MSRRAQMRPGWLFVLSARTPEELKAHAQRLIAHLTAHPSIDSGDLAFTLLQGRRHFRQRLACIAGRASELRSALEQWVASGSAPQVYAARVSEDGLREQVSLKESGQQWIRECAHLRDAATYKSGSACWRSCSCRAIGSSMRSVRHGLTVAKFGRISLPAYPFAHERHWPQNRPRKPF